MSRLPASLSTTSNLLKSAEIYVQSLQKNRPTIQVIKDIRNMLMIDNITGLAYESLTLLIIGLIGSYNHEDQKIQDYINDMLQNMDNLKKSGMGQSMIDVWEDCCSYVPYGFVYAQPIYAIVGGEPILKEMIFLEQELTQFEGTKRQIKNVTYRGFTDHVIPYESGFHLINNKNVIVGNNPYGVRQGEKALYDWDVYKIFQGAYAVLGQKQATKFIAGFTDTAASLDDDDDPNTPQVERKENNEMMLETLEGIGNSSVGVFDIEDRVEVVDQTSDGKFFENGFHMLDTRRFRSFYHPSTIFNTALNGTGDSGLAEQQNQNMMRIVQSKAEYIAQTFIRQVIRPLLIFKFGEQSDYGRIAILGQDPKTLEFAELYIKVIDTLSKLTTVEPITNEAIADLQLMVTALKKVLKVGENN
jgi:hypothetical protein